MQYKDIIFKSFTPIYYVSKVVGFMPVTYKRRSSKKCRIMQMKQDSIALVWSWLSVLYSGCWLAVFVTVRFAISSKPPPLPTGEEKYNYTFNSNADDNFTVPEGPSEGENVILSMSQILESTCSILIIITGVFCLRKLPHIFRQFQLLDDYIGEDGYYLLGSEDRKMLIKKGVKFSIISVVVCFSYTFLGTFFATFMALHHGGRLNDIYPHILQDVLKLGNVAGEIQFLNLCFFLRQRFRILNNILKHLQGDIKNIVNKLRTKIILQQWSLSPLTPEIRHQVGKLLPYDPHKRQIPEGNTQKEINRLSNSRVLSSNRDSVAESLSRLCRWHRRLCDIIDMISSCYELTLLVSIIYCFANSVFGIYTFLKEIGSSRLVDKLPDVLWTASYTCRMILISIIPSLTISQATKSRVLVERLNNRSLDNSSKEEITIFISHLSSRNMSFSICGFFTLNILFLRSIAVAIVTYVILLIQFKIK